MAFIVTSACFGCKYTDCVVVCPVEAFCEGDLMLYIDPETCIDCAQCAAACPVEAIYPEENVPEGQKDFIALNAEMAARCPSIYERKRPLIERD